MPAADQAFQSAMLNNLLYVFDPSGGGVNPNPIFIYDPAKDLWTIPPTTKTAPPSQHGGAAAAVGGMIYLFWGNETFAYDPSTNQFLQKAPMPTPRQDLAAAVVNGVIYLMGGTGGSQANEAYDPSTDTWTQKAPLPTGRGGLGAAVAGGVIYAIGGNAPGFPTLSTNEAYDPGTDSWTSKKPMSTPRSNTAIGTIRDRLIFSIGGMIQDPTTQLPVSSGLNEAYDVGTDSWMTKEPMITPRASSGVGILNDSIYVVGGANVQSKTSTPSSSNEAFWAAGNSYYVYRKQ
jgi:N-acetylneuraminic acid mutarotase